MANAPETRVSLLIRLKDRRDNLAWAEFLGIYEPIIYRLARRRGLQDADAVDLTQQVLMAVVSKVQQWDPDRSRGSFRSWLFQVARNLGINLANQRRRSPLAGGDRAVQDLLQQAPAPTSEDSSLFDIEYRRSLFHYAAQQIRQEFRATTWSAFWETCVEGRPIADVASRLDLSVGAVYIARSRVLARLRLQIEQLEEGL